MRSKISIITITILISLFGIEAKAYTVTSFNPTVYNGNTPSGIAAFDAAVGIATNYRKENFSDGTLIPGLSISFAGNPATTILSEPCTPTGTFLDKGGLECSTAMSWDSEGVFATDVSLGDAVFTYSPGTRSMGVGIGDLESDVGSYLAMFVNDNTLIGFVSALDNYVRHNEGREVYLRIDAESGDANITELRFTHVTPFGAVGDGVRFDRLAVAYVPLPASIWLFGSALIGLAGISCKKKKK